MKTKFILLISCFCLFRLEAQVQQTFTQLIPSQQKIIEIDLGESIKIIKGNYRQIKIVSNVTLYNSGTNTLNMLARTGQFKLKVEEKFNSSLLTDNPMRSKTKVNGMPLRTKIVYEIYLPRDVIYYYPKV